MAGMITEACRCQDPCFLNAAATTTASTATAQEDALERQWCLNTDWMQHDMQCNMIATAKIGLLTLNLTPGISPTACPLRPNPAISTSSCTYNDRHKGQKGEHPQHACLLLTSMTAAPSSAENMSCSLLMQQATECASLDKPVKGMTSWDGTFRCEEDARSPQ